MKKTTLSAASLAVLVALLLFSLCRPAYADDVDNAYKVCQVFSNTGMASECEVKGWGSFVDVRLDTSGTEAQKICSGVVSQVAGVMSFDGQWKLRIFSPFSGDHPLATCSFR